MGLMRLGQKKFELTYHYVGDGSTHRAIQIGNSLIDAVNLTLADENWRAIVFDSWIEEDFNEEDFNEGDNY